MTGCVEVGSGEGSELDAVECWLLSLLSVSGVWQAETVAAADTRCKVAFSTTALCAAAGASDGAVTVGGVVGERVGLHGSDGAGDGGARSGGGDGFEVSDDADGEAWGNRDGN